MRIVVTGATGYLGSPLVMALLTGPIARSTLGLVKIAPGPLAAALRTSHDILITLTPKVRTA